jgi:2-desacetyl-2-hydroxyethyl bacteriochlorophyllide A dehydrogenase
MLQIVLEQPGQFATRQQPEPLPGPDEVLVGVRRIGVCGTDLHAFAGRQPFFSYPRVLGHELGVEVLEPGSATGLKRGDRCAVEPYLNCGRCVACRRGKTNCCVELKVLGVHVDGGMQPLLAVPAAKLHRSAQLDFEQLALVETLGIGAHAVERGEIRADDFVLIIGAGPIGLSVVQFALTTGAQIAVMDISERRLEFCRRQFGVSHILKPEEGAARLKSIGAGDLPTVVFDATGNAGSMASTFELTAHGGRIVFVGLFQGDVTFNDPNFHRRELTLCSSRNGLAATFRTIIEKIEKGQINTKPWITHRFPLADTPRTFSDVARDSGLLKAMITVA